MRGPGGWRDGRLPNATASSAVWSSEDGAAWELDTARAGWAAREGGAGVAFKGRLWILGGTRQYYFASAGGGGALNDVWSSPDGKRWTLATSDAGWGPRAYHSAVVLGGRIYIYGGGTYQTAGGSGTGRDTTGYQAFNDVWSSADGIAWRVETASAPWPPRMWAGAAVYARPVPCLPARLR